MPLRATAMVTERILIPRRAPEMAVPALSAVILPDPSRALRPARDSALAAECGQRQAVDHSRWLEQCGSRQAAARWPALVNGSAENSVKVSVSARNCRHH